MFADVILPLPLYGSFTYSLPEEMEPQVKRGSRVLVQFGPKKIYTAIVENIHNVEPKGFGVKPVLDVLDPEPVLLYPQLKFWHWIADYYLCSVGDVYRAAIPAGLKVETETKVALNPDYDPGETASPPRLTSDDELILDALKAKPALRLSELEKETGVKGMTRKICRLMTLGIVNVSEGRVEKYRPKKETFVSLTVEKGNSEGLHALMDLVKGAPKQERALLSFLQLTRWMQKGAETLTVSREELLAKAEVSPAILRAMVDKGIFRQSVKHINRFSRLPEASAESHLSPLSESQQKALREISTLYRSQNIVLLHGLTGSGKTEIYTHLIDKVLRLRRQVLYLVPEIALTTQLTDRLAKVFGHRMLVYHSKFSDSERVDIYKRLLTDPEPVVVIGARSALFLPFTDLGLVVVDEEHESSFKQQDPAPRYNARDAAMVLAQMHGAKTLLGSATPSVETYYKATTGKFGLVTLSERYSGVELPDVQIVDLKEQRRRKESFGILSAPMKRAVNETLRDGKQVILFQNRRGFAPMVVCKDCGWTPKCVNCDVGMVYHKHSGQLRCHYCGHSYQLPPLCPACGQQSIEVYGYGTERIAESVDAEFEEAKVRRMDLDTTRSRDAHQTLIEEFANHDTDILVGTQMVSKGLDFANVRTVGVLNADSLLNYPDFRSNERAFNMIEQVGGRAGRRDEKGLVLIQTHDSDNPVLRHLAAHDYLGFYNDEIEDRRRYGYPPFSKVINITLKHADRSVCLELAVLLAKHLKEIFGSRVLGPEEPSVKRVSRLYIQRIMLKVEANASMRQVKNLLRGVHASSLQHPLMKKATLYFDVDPS